MDIPAKKFLRLLATDQPADVRAAAAVVAGELGVREAAEALTELLNDEEPIVRHAAIKAVGQVRAAEALPTLLDRVSHGGPEAGPAAESAAALGVKGVKGLRDLLHAVAPGVRRYIAAALTNSSTAGADAAGLEVLLDKDPQIASGAASAIIANVPTLAADRRTALATELVAVASNKKKPLAPAAEQAVVRVMVALRDPTTAVALWDRVLAPHSVDIRSAALGAVGGWITTPSKEQWAKLLTCAADPDFRVAAPALMIMSRLPVTDKLLADWVQLFHAPDLAARRMAVDKVGGHDSTEVAAGLMVQFNHSDRSLRDAARAKLQASKTGRKAILAALTAATTGEEMWPIARVAAGFKADIPPAVREQVKAAAIEHIAANDHRADPLLYLLRESDPAGLQEALLETAVALRKKKKYDEALTYLKVIARDPAVGFAVRFELAVCGLKVSGRELAPNARDGDPCLRSFDTLFQQDADLLQKEMEKAKFLDDEELFYVGFHFAERIGREKGFGVELLKLVVKRSPKADVGKAAKNKLKAVGE